MGTVKLTTPFSDAVVEVDESRVDKLAGLGWSPVAKPASRKSAKSDSDK